MLQRYVKLHPFLNKLDDTKLDIFLLRPTEDRRVENILDLMKDMEEVQLGLKRNNVTLSDIRDNFSEVIKEFLSM